MVRRIFARGLKQRRSGRPRNDLFYFRIHIFIVFIIMFNSFQGIYDLFLLIVDQLFLKVRRDNESGEAGVFFGRDASALLFASQKAPPSPGAFEPLIPNPETRNLIPDTLNTEHGRWNPKSDT